MPKSRKTSRILLVAALMMAPLTPASAQGVIYASPHTTYSPQPEYPEAARTAGAEGAVVIQVQIDANGNVTDAKVSSGDPLLTDSALKAVRTWRFEPTRISGQGFEGVLATLEDEHAPVSSRRERWKNPGI